MFVGQEPNIHLEMFEDPGNSISEPNMTTNLKRFDLI